MMSRKRKSPLEPYHERTGLPKRRLCPSWGDSEDWRAHLTPFKCPVSSQPKPHFAASVKVENLSKDTTQATLERKIGHLGAVGIHVMNCGPSHPANYAYVNCQTHRSAELIIQKLDNHLLDGNLLKAKVKGGHRESSTEATEMGWNYGSEFSPSEGSPRFSRSGHRNSRDEYSGSRLSRNEHSTSGFSRAGHSSSGFPRPGHSSSDFPRAPPAKDLCSVKVLVYGNHQFITGDPLDEYFSQYGEVTSRTIIRRGTPDYAYINFQNPLSAVRCRAESPHTIQGVSVIVPPPKATKSGVHHGSSVASSEYTCDPLVVSYVEKDANCYFQDNGHQVKMLTQENTISLYAFTEGKEITGEIEQFMKKRIRRHEAKVKSIDNTLDCCYLPLLVDPSVQKKLNEIQVRYEFIIKSRDSQDPALHSYSSLEDVSEVYSHCDEKTVHAEELKHYVFPSGPSEHKWSWEEGKGEFKSYDNAVCEKLDQALSSDSKTIQVSIGKHSYEIDTANMLQTNLVTKTKRKIKHDTVNSSEKYNLAIQLRAHSDHIHDIKREIMKTLKSAFTENFITIPSNQDSSFVGHLLQTARQNFVSADMDCSTSNTMTLKGAFEAEKRAEIKLKEEILEKQLKETESARLKASYENLAKPAHWEEQVGKCELKDVAKGSKEWEEIEQLVKDSASNMKISQIERIQNLWLWEIYINSRKRMSDKNHGTVNEKRLFHGSKYTPPKVIYNSEQGFDNRLASKGMWGEGSYFAVKASYSDGYAHTTPEGHKQMFLANVLTGITCKCNSNHSLKLPPKKSETTLSGSHGSHAESMFEGERYDSVCGFTSGSEIYVIYEHGKVYPAYLITYKTNYSMYA